jgi:signal transduction histidine kinase/CheY-like chemotaxis protein
MSVAKFPARIFSQAAAALAALLLAGASLAASTTFFESDFIFSNMVFPPEESALWQRQTLPDDWRQTRPQESGSGWYRLRVVLDAPPQGVHALYVPRAGDQVELFVNGVLIARTGGADAPLVRTWKRPHLFSISPDRLVSGENLIHVRLFGKSGHQSGLSPLRFGLEEELRGDYWKRFATQTVGPVALAAALGLIGLFFLVLWSHRRQDAMYALFATASLLWAARNVIDLLFYQAIPQPHWEIWMTVLYQAFVGLLCLFSLRFVGVRLFWYENVLRASIFVSPLAYYASLPFLSVHLSTRFGLFFALAMAVPPALAVGVAAVRRREPGTVMMALVGAISVGFGAYDWFGSFQPQMFDSIRLMPYLALFYTATAGWLLTQRFLSAYGELERLNVELDQRVAQKSAQLMLNMEQLERARAKAEEANRAKSRFLAAASHDLRQPLHALGLFASALMGEVSLPRPRELVGKISRCVDALEKMFAELMDISRIDAGTVAVGRIGFALQGMFDRIEADFLPLAREKGLRLRIRPTREWTRSDPLMFERILRNLVSNAIRYTERGGVLVACRRRGETLWIQVWDSGIGIAEKERERIFEEFYQVGNPERDRSKGIGLGLSIVRRLAELLDEVVAFRSVPGRGSVFQLRTPRVPAETPAPAAALPGVFAHVNLVVALLEDDPLVREAMASLLERNGMEVASGADSQDLLGALARTGERPGLIVADYQLRGGESGVAAVRAVRNAFGKAIPVILVTGQTSAEHLAEATASGFPVLRKPVQGGKLLALIRATLASEEMLSP